MTSTEFLTIISAYQYPVTETGSGGSELFKVLRILQRRQSISTPKSILADMCLWSEPLRDGTTCKIHALPSQAASLLAKRNLVPCYKKAMNEGAYSFVAQIMWL